MASKYLQNSCRNHTLRISKTTAITSGRGRQSGMKGMPIILKEFITGIVKEYA